MNWWCTLRHVVPYCPYGRVNVPHSDLHNTTSFLHLWKILLVKSQKSMQCGCKSVRDGCAGPCNNWFLRIVFRSSHIFRPSVVAFLRIRSNCTDMCKPVSIQDPDYLCFHINVALTSDCGECHACKKCDLVGEDPLSWYSVLCSYITTWCSCSLDRNLEISSLHCSDSC